ncbi:hypothetical protein [Bradyrhizobium sp. CCBAU 51753]|uniref:hypothetical protein n=1 Tax=Bradyrhizobium sp. CCBAU 51753 TaxID=1325100 RepID=UPI00188C94FA|nr:hypothetical protein [Bradyrhizobium sp. CCBAU 51753]QOZ25312.1 hypothetical protein XH93_18225 [Bradyrhizobium sp. CCBAU 51753]
MARKKGDGSKSSGASAAPRQTLEELTDDQRYSLLEQHRQTHERLLAAKKAADAALRNHGKIVKADLGKNGMDQIKCLIEASTPEGEKAIRARIEQDAQVLRWLGVPIGTQADMFPSDDRTPLAERAFNEGKRQGLAGESCNNPHHVTTEAHREHNRGYGIGQEQLASKGFKKLEDNEDEEGDGKPKGSFVDTMRAQNDAVQEAIKNGTIDQLGTKRGAAAVDSLAAH